MNLTFVCSPEKILQVETLYPLLWSVWEELGLDESGILLNGISVLLKARREPASSLCSPSQKDTGEVSLSCLQTGSTSHRKHLPLESTSHRILAMQPPGSWTSSLQNCGKWAPAVLKLLYQSIFVIAAPTE